MARGKELSQSVFAAPRVGSQVISAEQSLKLVAPHHAITRGSDGRRMFYGGETSWQRMMMDVVIASNGFKNALSQIDVLQRKPEHLNIITNDAFRFVANEGRQPHAQDRRANFVEAVGGWLPVIPLIWDVPMLASRVGRRMRGEGLGAVAPAFWTTLTDIPSRVFIPGSVPSSRQAVGYYQQAMYHVMAEDMYGALSSIDPATASHDQGVLRRKYVDMIEQVDPKLVSGVERTMRKLSERALGRRLKNGEQLPRLEENKVIAGLSSGDVALYYLGQNLLDSVALVKGSPPEASAETSVYFPQA